MPAFTPRAAWVGLAVLLPLAAPDRPPAWAQPTSAPSAAALLAPPSPLRQPAATPGLVAYVEGVDALGAGRFPDAVAALSRALAADGDNPRLVFARGVAETLAEQFPQALGDFQRAQRLGLPGRAPELWGFVARRMAGPDPTSAPGNLLGQSPDFSADFAQFVYGQMAFAYWRLRQKGGDPAPVRALMAEAGRRAAGLLQGDRALVPVLFQRAGQLATQKRYAEALGELGPVRAAYPSDPEVRDLAGVSWLALGHAETARRELTIALTERSDLGAAYLARAWAHARLGDAPRARADLALASKLDSAAAGRDRTGIEAEIAKHTPPGAEPEALLAGLEQAARAGAADAELLTRATAVQLAMNARRVRYDETYQDRRRRLEDAVRADPRNPDKLVDLGQYLADESAARGEAPVPRAPIALYRYRESEARELGRAEQFLDLALQLNPKHVRALAVKAIARTYAHQYAEAEALVNRALVLGGNTPDVLRLHARFLMRTAGVLSAQATDLLQTHCSSGLVARPDGWHDVTTCTYPGAAEKARAAELDAQAQALVQRATGALQAAIRATRGTAEASVMQATLDRWSGKYDAALADLREAIRLDPNDLEAHDALVDLLAKTGQPDEAEAAQAIERRLVQTTATPMLRVAWGRIEKTAWAGARTALASARQLDSADGRVAAWLAVVSLGEGKGEEALAGFRTALALEEARLALDGVGAGPGLSRDAEDVGLALRLELALAQHVFQAGQPAKALEMLQRAAALGAEVPRSQWPSPVYRAVLPAPTTERAPSPPSAATLLASTQVGLGTVLAALKRNDEATRAFTDAMQYGVRDAAVIGPAGVWLARAALAKGDVRQAQAWMNQATGPGASPAVVAELNRLIGEMSQRRQQETNDAQAQRERDLRQLQEDEARYGKSEAWRRYGARANGTGQVAVQGPAVDPALVGIWDVAGTGALASFRATYTVDAQGRFTFSREGGGAASGGGTVQAANGRVRFTFGPGQVSEGAYQVARPDVVLMQFQNGSLEWHRRR